MPPQNFAPPELCFELLGTGEIMKQQLLVIDDSEKIHPLVKTILADECLDIQSATDPQKGLLLAASMRPDLILLDVDMPGMSGFEVCKQLKSNRATDVARVIFLTSLSSLKEKVRGFELGAVDYVTKPFSRGELTARVRAALSTSRQIRSLEQNALVDTLTGLGNRAMFAQRFEAEICLRARFNNPLCCILIDLDHFERINETHGRSMGDQIMAQIARDISVMCRTEDVACHYGADEFVVITPHTSGSDAVVFAERICEMIEGTQFMPQELKSHPTLGNSIRVTASFGVAGALNRYDRSILQRADAALNRSKQEGGNRVSLAGPSLQAPGNSLSPTAGHLNQTVPADFTAMLW
jgi:diguanylate cyclase (GGDEF)-like protein